MIEIVRPGPRHLDAMIAFFRAINVPEIWVHFHPHPLSEKEARRVCRYSGRDEYYIALSGGSIAAYGMLRGWDEGYAVPSLGLCVRPSQGGKGLGLAMTAHLASAARMRGARRVMLKTKRSNTPAIRLYRKVGFHILGLDKDYLRGELNLGKR